MSALALQNSWVLLLLPLLWLLYRTKAHTLQTHLLFAALILIALALSRPVIHHDDTTQTLPAHDYIIALDASFSMQASDIKPSRFDAAINQISDLLAMHPKDRFTIMLFTSNALMISPPTTDTSLSLQALRTINTQYILTKSTSLSALFDTIANLNMPNKQLIIFSDGGEEQTISARITQCQHANITPFIVATATTDGAPLLNDGTYIKDANNHIVISKPNPILQPLAHHCGGYYYHSTDPMFLATLSEDMRAHSDATMLSHQRHHTTELFYYPLSVALLLFLLAVTRMHQFIIILLALLPLQSSASLLDFYHQHEAISAWNAHAYADAAKQYAQMTPTTRSYLNSASCYYRAKQYRKAIYFLARIQSSEPSIAQLRYALLGNIAVALKQYDRAKSYYVNALALGEMPGVRANLYLLYKNQLHTAKQIEVNLPEPNSNYRKSLKEDKKRSAKAHPSTKEHEQQDPNHTKNGTSSATTKVAQQRNGANALQRPTASPTQQKQHKQPSSANPYQVGYSTYELINKGYANENRPW